MDCIQYQTPVLWNMRHSRLIQYKLVRHTESCVYKALRQMLWWINTILFNNSYKRGDVDFGQIHPCFLFLIAIYYMILIYTILCISYHIISHSDPRQGFCIVSGNTQLGPEVRKSALPPKVLLRLFNIITLSVTGTKPLAMHFIQSSFPKNKKILKLTSRDAK